MSPEWGYFSQILTLMGENKSTIEPIITMNEEQSKISRNLHDGVAQDLAALKLYLEKEDLPKSKFYAQQAFNEVRYMIGATHLDLNQSFEEIVREKIILRKNCFPLPVLCGQVSLHLFQIQFWETQ